MATGSETRSQRATNIAADATYRAAAGEEEMVDNGTALAGRRRKDLGEGAPAAAPMAHCGRQILPIDADGGKCQCAGTSMARRARGTANVRRQVMHWVGRRRARERRTARRESRKRRAAEWGKAGCALSCAPSRAYLLRVRLHVRTTAARSRAPDLPQLQAGGGKARRAGAGKERRPRQISDRMRRSRQNSAPARRLQPPFRPFSLNTAAGVPCFRSSPVQESPCCERDEQSGPSHSLATSSWASLHGCSNVKRNRSYVSAGSVRAPLPVHGLTLHRVHRTARVPAVRCSPHAGDQV